MKTVAKLRPAAIIAPATSSPQTMQNPAAHSAASRARSVRPAPQFCPTIAPIAPDRASSGTITKLCKRPAAPNPATAASPSSATQAVRTERPSGLIALEKAAGSPTLMIARAGSMRSLLRSRAGLKGREVPRSSTMATDTPIAQPITVA